MFFNVFLKYFSSVINDSSIREVYFWVILDGRWINESEYFSWVINDLREVFLLGYQWRGRIFLIESCIPHLAAFLGYQWLLHVWSIIIIGLSMEGTHFFNWIQRPHLAAFVGYQWLLHAWSNFTGLSMEGAHFFNSIKAFKSVCVHWNLDILIPIKPFKSNYQLLYLTTDIKKRLKDNCFNPLTNLKHMIKIKMSLEYQ